METPKTLIEAIKFFSDKGNCRQFMISVRWADGIVRCPYCGSDNVLYMDKSNLYFCRMKHAKAKFSLKVGTVFEDSPIGLEKWLPTSWLISNCKNGVSSYEIARHIGVTQKTAWFMLHRIRTAMIEPDSKIGGTNPVEVDETFVGGKVKNMHKAKRDKNQKYVGGGGKAIVMGMLERGGKVRANVIFERKIGIMEPMLKAHVHVGSELITDEYAAYKPAAKDYVHKVVNHAVEYVNGHVHTNGIENFWSLLKRSLGGTYISVEPFHLDSYVVEQVYRYNNRREMNDAGRFSKVISQIGGKRLTYAELTGKEAGTSIC